MKNSIFVLVALVAMMGTAMAALEITYVTVVDDIIAYEIAIDNPTNTEKFALATTMVEMYKQNPSVVKSMFEFTNTTDGTVTYDEVMKP